MSYHRPKLLFILIIFILLPKVFLAQPATFRSPEELKKLTVEQLMNLEVTSVSKTSEKLSEVASAIQVITDKDILRSATTRLPEALRLASNLQVARSNSHDWGITARGFNGAPLSTNTLANKLLVMIDGRTVYSPLFGGVFWDVQNVLLEDIDRIEVVSGPGGTLWGANAVNGVINIISKTAKETQGLYASEAAGTFLRDNVAVRYGGRIDSSIFFRVYGQRFDHNSTVRKDGSDAQDKWNMTQGGFRMDYYHSPKNTFTLQGDFYGGKEDTAVTLVNGQNILGRWEHVFSGRSNLSLQVYFDRTYRNLTSAGFRDDLKTYDIDLQHSFYLGDRNKILWGAGYRLMDDEVQNSPGISFIPAERKLKLFNGFIQDQFSIIPRRLELTVGTKLLHNDYSGFELQPSIRMAWLPHARHTLWAAVSRAVRTPSRFDADEVIPSLITINQQFNSENVTAYELGYRSHPAGKVSYSIAAFYNKYDHIRSIDTNIAPPPTFVFANNQNATSWGFEFSGNLFIRDWWRLRGGYTYLQKDFENTAPGVIPGSDLFEALDPANQFMLQSIMDLPNGFQADVVGRYTDLLPASPVTASVHSYISVDVRLAWVYRRFTFAIAGQNLVENSHAEFGAREIPRSIYQKITLRL